jgi:hypothetical protein
VYIYKECITDSFLAFIYTIDIIFKVFSKRYFFVYFKKILFYFKQMFRFNTALINPQNGFIKSLCKGKLKNDY